MSKSFKLASICAVLFLLHTGSGNARGLVDPARLALEDYSLEQLADTAPAGAKALPEVLQDEFPMTPVLRATVRLCREHNGDTSMGLLRYLTAGPDMRSKTARVLQPGCRAQSAMALSAGAVLQDIHTRVAPSSADASGRIGLATSDPCSYRQLRSSHGLAHGLGADLLLRRVARLPQPAVPGYHALDVRSAWQAGPGVELALTGRNLPHAGHPEFGVAGLRQLAECGVFASASRVSEGP